MTGAPVGESVGAIVLRSFGVAKGGGSGGVTMTVGESVGAIVLGSFGVAKGAIGGGVTMASVGWGVNGRLVPGVQRPQLFKQNPSQVLSVGQPLGCF